MPQKLEYEEKNIDGNNNITDITTIEKNADAKKTKRRRKNKKSNDNKHKNYIGSNKGLIVAIVIIIIIITFFAYLTWSIINIRSREMDDISDMISKSQQGNRSLHMLVKFFQIHQNLKNLDEETEQKEDITQEILYNTAIPIEKIEEDDKKKVEEKIFMEPMVRQIIKFIDGLLGIETTKIKQLNDDILLRKAYFEERNRHYSESIALFNQFLDENKDNISDNLKADIYLHLGYNYAVQNMIEDAKTNFANVYKLSPPGSDTYSVAIKIQAIITKLEEEQKKSEEDIKKIKNMEDDLNIKELLATYNRLLKTNDLDTLIELTENFIKKNNKKIKFETPLENKWRVSTSASYFYRGRALEEKGGTQNIDNAIKDYNTTINTGKTMDIDENKVEEAYERITINEKLYNVETEDKVENTEALEDVKKEKGDFDSTIDNAVKFTETNENDNENNNNEEDEYYTDEDDYDNDDTGSLLTSFDTSAFSTDFEEELEEEIKNVEESIEKETSTELVDNKDRENEEELARLEEEEAKRKAEEEAKRKAEEEAKRLEEERKAEEEAKKKAEEEAKRLEEERLAEEEAKRLEEEEAKKKAEEEAKKKAEEEAKRKAEEEAKKKAEEEAKRLEEEEAKKKAEEEAKRKAEEEALKKRNKAIDDIVDGMEGVVEKFTTLDFRERFQSNMLKIESDNPFNEVTLSENQTFQLVDLDSIDNYIDSLLDGVYESIDSGVDESEKIIIEEKIKERKERERRLNILNRQILDDITNKKLKINIDYFLENAYENEEDITENTDINISINTDGDDIKTINLNEIDLEELLSMGNNQEEKINLSIEFKNETLEINLDNEDASIKSLIDISKDFKRIIESSGNYHSLVVKIESMDDENYEGEVIKQEDNYYIIKSEEGYTIRIFKDDIKSITITDNYENIIDAVSPNLFNEGKATYEASNLVRGYSYMFKFSSGAEVRGKFLKVKGNKIIITDLDSDINLSFNKEDLVSATPIEENTDDTSTNSSIENNTSADASTSDDDDNASTGNDASTSDDDNASTGNDASTSDDDNASTGNSGNLDNSSDKDLNLSEEMYFYNKTFSYSYFIESN